MVAMPVAGGVVAAAVVFLGLLHGPNFWNCYYWILQSGFSFHVALSIHDRVTIFPFLDRRR